jgi:hypothetical protein
MRPRHSFRPRPSSTGASSGTKLLTVASLIVLAVVGPAFAAHATEDAIQASSGVTTSSHHRLEVYSAGVAQLVPGARADIPLEVTNRTGQLVTIRSVTTTRAIVTGSAGACSAADFTVAHRVPALAALRNGETRRLVLRGAVRMNASAGNGCQDAHLRLTELVGS